MTPFWFALGVLFKYRTMSNYRNPEFLGPRIGDKLIFSLIIMSVRPCPEQTLILTVADVCPASAAAGGSPYGPSRMVRRLHCIMSACNYSSHPACPSPTAAWLPATVIRAP